MSPEGYPTGSGSLTESSSFKNRIRIGSVWIRIWLNQGSGSGSVGDPDPAGRPPDGGGRDPDPVENQPDPAHLYTTGYKSTRSYIIRGYICTRPNGYFCTRKKKLFYLSFKKILVEICFVLDHYKQSLQVISKSAGNQSCCH